MKWHYIIATLYNPLICVAMNKLKIKSIFARFAQAAPLPTTELRYNSHFELLIAVILSAQATDKSVNKATALLFAIADTPAKMAALGESNLKQYIKTIWLYNSKAANIIKTCQALVANFAGQVPDNRPALESLPGVGRKTANVVLNTCFAQPALAVDTHIFRVANRLGLARSKTPRGVEDQLLKVIPAQFLLHAHHWLLLHGRYVCVARKPRCPTCLVNDLCEYKMKTIAE